MNNVVVTVNGISVEEVIAEEVADEIQTSRSHEIGTAQRAIRSHIITTKIRNHSGARSSKGRVIYSAAAAAGGSQC